MKQLTVYCSEELSEDIQHILHHYDLEGFIHEPGMVATKFKPKGSYGKDMSWQTNIFVVFPEDQQLEGIVGELKHYINACEIEPCLRIIVTSVDLIY